MKDLNFGKKITFIFAAILVVVILSVTAIRVALLLQAYKQAQRLATDAIPSIEQIYVVNNDTNDMQLALLGAVTATSQEEVKKFKHIAFSHAGEISENLSQYMETLNDPMDRANFKQMLILKETYEKARDRAFKLLDEDKNTEARALYHSCVEPAYSTYGQQLDNMTSWNLYDAKKRATNSAGEFITVAIISLAASVIVLTIVIGFSTVMMIQDRNYERRNEMIK